MVHSFTYASVVALALHAGAGAAAAQEYFLNVGGGYFALRGEDARTPDDVLVRNLGDLDFAIGDFSHAAVTGDLLVALGGHLEGGIGLGYYRRTVPSFYRGFVNLDGSEIEQDLRLRIVPVTVTIRFLPLGRHGAVQPYVGGGLAFLSWRYSEVGEFVDFRSGAVLRDRFADEGRDTVPVLIGGLRVPVGDRLSMGGEIRFNRGVGALDPGAGFLSDEIDLGGMTSAITALIRF